MAKNIHNPHDRFMKSLLGDINIARQYFELAPLIEEKQLTLLLDQVPKVMKPEFIRLADHLWQEGRQEEAERKDRIATEKLLQKGADVVFICDVLDVTPVFVEEVRKKMEAKN